MTAILPISTVRVSDQLVRTRLTQQVQSDQLDLFRIQNQLSTGRRIFTPSEDAPSALRAITLQRNLERKTQIQLNLDAAQRSLSAAGSALNESTRILSDIRAEAISVTGTDVTQESRDAVVRQVDEAITSLLNIGNSQFRDNFLFGGSFDAGSPFVSNGDYVEYRGNEQSLQSFVDSNLLFDINITGQETLGGISDAVRGSTELSPQLTSDTLLSQLNGGVGVTSDGAIQINFVPDSPGGIITESATIDLRAANTVGDVARLLEAGAPPSAGLKVSIVGDQLSIETSGPTAGGVTIVEVGQGQTAQQLGIRTTGTTDNLTGESLDPTLRLTTRLDSLLGSRAQARLVSGGGNNDLIISATENGENAANGDPLDGVLIEIVDGGLGATAGAAYNAGANRLTVTIDAAAPPSAAEVADLINAEPNGYFTATIDPSDATSLDQAGLGSVSVTNDTTIGGAGTTLDLASGVLLENGEGPVVIDTSDAETVFDLLEAFNQPELGLVAQLNSTQTGIDIRTRRSGADFAIGENGGVLAQQLGVRTFTLDSRLEDFNRGLGITVDQDTPEAFATNNVFEIEITDGGATNTYRIDLTGLVTVGDLVDQIAADTGGAIQASLSLVGNGLVLSGTAGQIAAPETAAGSFEINGDTLTLTANTPGSAGNQAFSVNVIDQGTDGLSVGVDGNVITVNLGGDASDTADVAAAIDAELADYTVSVSTAPLVTTQSGLTASTTGGVATPSTGDVVIDGDTLTFTADTPGAAGDQTFTLNITDGGVGGLTVTPTGNTLNIDLGGAAPDTAALALEISNQLAGFTVTSDGTAPVTSPQAGLNATTAGGAATNSTGEFILNGNTITLTADTPGAANDQDFTINVVDNRFGGLSVGVDGNVITVDLGGATADTTDVAAAIDTALADFSVGVSTAPLVTTQSGLTASTTGGVATPSTGDVVIDGDTLTFIADTPGAAGDQTFTLNITDGGVGGLTVTPAGNTLNIDLGGATPDTAALALEISNQLAGFTVTSDGTASVTSPQAGLTATTGGGAAVNSTGEFVLNGNTITLTADTPGAASDQDFTINVVSTNSGGLSVDVTGGVITVELGGDTPGTAEVAAAIDAQLAGYSASVDLNAVVTPQQSATVTTTGGLDLSATGTDVITVRGSSAERLGFLPPGADPAEATSSTGAIATVEDRNTFEVDSAFDTLIRLRNALVNADVPEISAAIEELDVDLNRAVFAESEVGARVQTLDVLEIRLEDEEVQLRSALSDEIDVDLTEAISEFTTRQFALQASLQTSASLLNLTILNFI